MAFAINPLDVQGITGPRAPLSRSVVRALLAKHGAPAPAMTAPAPVAPAPAMPAPVSAPVPLNLGSQPLAPSFDDGVNAAQTLSAAANPPTLKAPGGGLIDRIGDFLHSNEGRAEAMRFAAGAFNGGFGGGLTAATNYADERSRAQAAAIQNEQENALRGRQLDITQNLGLGRLDIDAAGMEETGRHNRAGEGIDRSRINMDYRKHVTPSGDAVVNSNERRFEHITPSGDTQTTQAGENYRHDNASGDATLTQAGENYRHTTPSGDKVLDVREQTAPRINMHAHYTTTPEEYARNGPRLKPSEVRPASPAGQPVQITGDADYAALPSGTHFVGPDGVPRVKP